MKILEPKLQKPILYVTRRVVQFEDYCTQCPNFSTKSQIDLNYHIANKHSAPKPDVTFKFKLSYQEFPIFYALRQQRKTQHGMQIGSRTRDVDVEHIVGDVDDHRLR